MFRYVINVISLLLGLYFCILSIVSFRYHGIWDYGVRDFVPNLFLLIGGFALFYNGYGDIERIHFERDHNYYSGKKKNISEKEIMEKELNEALSNEDYEKAAELRDKINKYKKIKS